MDGEINVSGEFGKGSIFTVTLPINIGNSKMLNTFKE
jgi:signal transduction histidine kinase